ncbi:MAG TPA: DUF5063 domain-containing protein [Bacteroidales bacterium]|nr:DUF5063 domain-containing protein [Bacteroidales bacterium]HOR81483.1 DUF5063 domain-containing protein [Bacteroidales bacterium]HPJ90658.1 DUF5063 domain-containing protein [Bacteroidales bacterium]HPX58803.1 DUF5063 domain-containing protein [Bacteroidales bacterium]HQB19798.1 DUF5063 domain-containing protein [Bacteroidales bacterium]
MNIEDVIESQNTKDLHLVASQFCTFIEKIQPFQQQDAMEYLIKIIPLLYIKGILIPHFEFDEEENMAIRLLTEEEYEIAYLSIKEKFDTYNYFEFFNQSINQVESIDLSELIADLYQDLKDFVLFFNQNTFRSQSAALWLCRVNFYERWGKIITQLLAYLHPLLFPSQVNDY